MPIGSIGTWGDRMRNFAADDADAIAGRLKELERERRAIFACTRTEVVDTHGHAARSWSAGCPIHGLTPDTQQALAEEGLVVR